MPRPDMQPEYLVIGLGSTGWSIVNYLRSHQIRVSVTDTRNDPPMLARLKEEYPEVPCYLGGFDSNVLNHINTLVVSPGVDPSQPFFEKAHEMGLEIIGDIELFARAVTKPVIAITGSNGKSTVTILVAGMVEKSGMRVAMGGNLGTPALDLLQQDADLFVLELSSFQLEMTHSLKTVSSVVLNISDDHIDRHGSLEHYARVKAGIYDNAQTAVINRDDPLTRSMARPGQPVVGFTGQAPGQDDYGLLIEQQNPPAGWLVRGDEKLLHTSDMKMSGLHNALNALAALALGGTIGLDRASMLQTLREFPGLPHRCQWVREINGVNWYNDSKGTNPGATLAAINGLPGPIILLAGGVAKQSDFSSLAPAMRKKGKAAVLFGRDAGYIETGLAQAVPVFHEQGLKAAVSRASKEAQPGDSVLLSPACASFDQFTDYRERGECFMQAVRAL